MNMVSKRTSIKIGWGILVLASIGLVLSFPTFKLRWNARFYQDQYQAKMEKEALQLLPKVKQSTTASLHVLYQDLMTQAGNQQTLQRQYRDWIGQDKNNAALLALQSRVLSQPDQKQQVLDQAVSIQPDEETVQLIQAERLLDSGQACSAQHLLSASRSNSWFRWLLEARLAQRLGDIGLAKNHFLKAVQSAGAPLSTAIEYAQFLTTWTDITQGGVANPFAQWSKDKINQNPLAYAYYQVLTGASFEDVVKHMPEPVSYHPQALALLSRLVLSRYHPYRLQPKYIKRATGRPGEEPRQIQTIDIVASHENKSDEIKGSSSALQEVRQWLERAYRIDSRNPVVLVYRGLLEEVEKNLKQAEKFYHAGLQKTGGYATHAYHQNMGEALASIGHYELALEHFKKAFRRVPENVLLLKSLAKVHLLQEQSDPAISLLEKVRSLIPSDMETLHLLGDIYFQKEDLDNARSVYQEVIAADEHDRKGRDRIAEIWMKRNRPDRALQVYRALLRRDPDNGYCCAQIARILLRVNKTPQRAEKFLNETINTRPNIRDMPEILKSMNEIQLAKDAQK